MPSTLTPEQRRLRARIAAHTRSSQEGPAPTGWDALLALVDDWGTTLRLILLLSLPIAAVVVIVALIVIRLGPIGTGALLTGGVAATVSRRCAAKN